METAGASDIFSVGSGILQVGTVANASGQCPVLSASMAAGAAEGGWGAAGQLLPACCWLLPGWREKAQQWARGAWAMQAKQPAGVRLHCTVITHIHR